MDLISQWWPAILLLLAFFDKEAALLVGALFAASAITGPIEASLTLGFGTLLITGFYFRQGLKLRIRFHDGAMPNVTLVDKVESWLSRFGLPLTTFIAQIVFSRKETIHALAVRSEEIKRTYCWLAVGSILWTTVGIFCLTLIGQILIEELSTLIRVRMLLPGLTLLVIICSTVFRIAVRRSLHHYHGTWK